MPAVDCCVQLIHSILCTVLWTKYLVKRGSLRMCTLIRLPLAGSTRVLSDNESKVFFEKVKGQYPEMDIKIPFLTVMETLQYKPAESAAKVQCPVLVVIAGQDSVNPPEQGRALYDAVASGTKELYEEADACHYDIYEGAFFERVAAVQTQWFKKHL